MNRLIYVTNGDGDVFELISVEYFVADKKADIYIQIQLQLGSQLPLCIGLSAGIPG